MQRYSDGLPVPKQMVDVFSGETTDGGGNLTLSLTYKPKAIGDIIVPDGWSVGGKRRMFTKHSLVGKVLTLTVQKLEYDKADSPTSSSNTGNTGADPHSHALAYTATEQVVDFVPTEAQRAIPVHYTVA